MTEVTVHSDFGAQEKKICYCIHFSPIILWQLEGEKVEAVTDFIFFGSQSLQTVTATMKLRDLFFGRKTMKNLDSVLKSKHITLPTKVHVIKAMIFPVLKYG